MGSWNISFSSSEFAHYGVKGMKWGVRKDRSSSRLKRFNRKMKRIDSKYIDELNKPYTPGKVNKKMLRLAREGERLVDDLFDGKVMNDDAFNGLMKRLPEGEKKRVMALVERYIYGADFEDDPYKKLY